MFHESNLGSFSSIVAPYADASGYVPKHGDKRNDFGLFRPTPRNWKAFVASAVEAASEAENRISQWQK